MDEFIRHSLRGGSARLLLIICLAFGWSVGCVAWRLARRAPAAPRGLGICLGVMALTSCAAYRGGERLPHIEGNLPAPATAIPIAPDQILAAQGRKLFLISCAHCHGADGRGDGPDEGADLRSLRKSDERIARVIQEGVQGEMPKFGSKFSDAEIQALTAYIRSLR